MASCAYLGNPADSYRKLSVSETSLSDSNKNQDLDQVRLVDNLHSYSLHLPASITLICLFR